jgi:hypothetical protein
MEIKQHGLNNQRAKEEILKEIKKFIETNEYRHKTN